MSTRPSLIRRLGQRLTSGIATLFYVIFIIVLVVYGAANIWTQFRTCCIVQLFFDAPEGPRLRAFDTTDPDDVRLVESLIRACQAADLDLNEVRVGIVELDIINAGSLGNHTFLLFEGLSKLGKQHRDAVMAHEVAHDLLGHADQSKSRYRSLSRALGVLNVVVRASSDTNAQVLSWTGDLAFPPFEKDAEFAADAKAIEILRGMGYRSNARQVMAGALRAIQDEVGDTGGGYFDSHPATSQRVAVIEGGK